MMDLAWRKIPLSRGTWAIVDSEDYPDLIQGPKWFAQRGAHGKLYAVRWLRVGSKRVEEVMARRIMKAPNGIEVDHIREQDTLDNRKSNLRLATRQQNKWNRGKQRNNTSGYKGVYWLEPYGKFQALIVVNRKHLSQGLFTDKVDAAHAYDAAALRYFGEFARLNFPQLGFGF